jgi:hypothetical protein
MQGGPRLKGSLGGSDAGIHVPVRIYADCCTGSLPSVAR